MKNNIIIAGVPRAGKSTMSNKLSREFGYQHVSMDAIIGGIETVFPELGIKWWPCESDKIEVLRIASEKVTLIIKAMLESGEYDEFETGMIVDAVQILPEHFIKHLSDKDCEIIYFLTADVTPEERFVIHRKHDTEKDYTSKFTDEQMSWHCNYIVERSKLLKEQCLKYGLQYFETAREREKVFKDCMQFIVTITQVPKKEDVKMQQSKLLTLLPEDYVSTPDGMSIDKNDGDLILACPNFADTTMPGCVVKIDKNYKVRKWFDVPVLAETGCSRPMGIEMAADGYLYIVDNQGWSGKDELMFKGRILKVKMEGDTIAECTVIAKGMEHPNGLRVKDGHIYVTQSMLSKENDPSGKLVSCVYKFSVNDKEIGITNTLADKNILTTFLTHNPDCQYGADGIVFDKAGNLYVGNFGDGAVHKITFNPDGSAKENTVWAKDEKEITSIDGLCIDDNGNIYVADFSVNAIAKIDPAGKPKRIAQSPDTDGLNGEIDQPGEPIVWNNKIVISCFDLVTDPGKVNTAHEMPATICMLDL